MIVGATTVPAPPLSGSSGGTVDVALGIGVQSKLPEGRVPVISIAYSAMLVRAVVTAPGGVVNVHRTPREQGKVIANPVKSALDMVNSITSTVPASVTRFTLPAYVNVVTVIAAARTVAACEVAGKAGAVPARAGTGPGVGVERGLALGVGLT